ncbi:MAG: hypothetical protein VKI39_07075 [Synechococcus sp.]|nr:hypothetical protein [Synechococcus sp.]
MPSPEPDSRDASIDWIRLIAAAADLCRKPLRHGVVVVSQDCDADSCWHPRVGELTLRLEARDGEGQRCPEEDLELEVYPSGSDLNLTLAWCLDGRRPILWQGSHPVWLCSDSGVRCERPADAEPLEAFTRRLRALLVG